MSNTLTRKAAWSKRRTYLIHTGRWKPFTDATPARKHIEALRRMGMSLDTITDIARMSTESVNSIVYPGMADYRHEIRRETERRILAVRFDLNLIPEQRWVHNAGSQRRLRALAVMGWGWSDLAARMGVSMERVSRLALKSENRITARNARIIRDLYDELAMTPGPNRRARTWAAKRGWHSALAWDDIDDPAAQPFIGSSSQFVHADDLEDLIRWGGTYTSIEARLGISHDGIYHRVRNRPELLAMLHRNADGAGIRGAA